MSAYLPKEFAAIVLFKHLNVGVFASVLFQLVMVQSCVICFDLCDDCDVFIGSMVMWSVKLYNL